MTLEPLRLPVLKNIVKEMIQEQVDQANRARYRMWKDLSNAYQENILKTRSFWEKHKEIKGPQSEELINQLVALEMLTQVAVTWYDEGPAVAAVHAGINLAFYLGFKGLGAAAAAFPNSPLAAEFAWALEGFGTGVARGLSYLWPVVLINVAYNTAYLAGNWTLDVLRYDTVDKLYVNPAKHNNGAQGTHYGASRGRRAGRGAPGHLLPQECPEGARERRPPL